MTTALLEALDRTRLLMRDDLVPSVTDERLLRALTGTSVALIASADELRSHSAQCAFVTAALTMARSAHRVTLVAPNVELCGAQPPLSGKRLIDALVLIGPDLLPGFEFSTALPIERVDLAVVFGASRASVAARASIHVNARAWSTLVCPSKLASSWQGDEWPIGGIVAGVLAATEAFKCAMRSLREFAADQAHFDELHALADRVDLVMAPAGTPQIANLGEFDLISGGAISHGLLYTLARVPNVRGYGRVADAERLDLSNANRYALMRLADIGMLKTDQLARLLAPNIDLLPVPERFAGSGLLRNRLHNRVLVGVDDIPTRWKAQEESPVWLGIGATTHWSAMASYHSRGLGCARCLHPRDEPGHERIPTAPFVSLLAGAHLACYFLTEIAGRLVAADQYVYGTPLRPTTFWRSPVSLRQSCPTCNGRIAPGLARR
jgi:hypothetical protein